MFGFTYRLVLEDDTPADPPKFSTAVPTWHEGDTFMVRPGCEFRIVRLAASDDWPLDWDLDGSAGLARSGLGAGADRVAVSEV
jgi:hypothetical protein